MAQLRGVLPQSGVAFEDVDVEFINRTGATLVEGDIVILDLQRDATETVDAIEGNESSIYVAVVDTNDNALSAAYAPFLCVTSKFVGDNQRGMAKARGRCKVKLDSNSGNVTTGNPLVPNTTANARSVFVATAGTVGVMKVVAWSVESASIAGGNLVECDFDGMGGHGFFQVAALSV